ncbi:MAG: aminomethyl-transferring glycine dehydrogenase subunit GcvPA [bacterium]
MSSQTSAAPYLALDEQQRAAILKKLQISEFSELEKDIPVKLKDKFKPSREGLSEESVFSQLQTLAKKNITVDELTCFLGGGVYDHYVPALVDNLLGRDEFLTSYTPYQPEMNQGTLQAMFEFQSMISELTALPVTNASMYDGATAFAEAVLMAVNQTGRNTVYYSPNLFSAWIEVLHTYGEPLGWELIALPSEAGAAQFPKKWQKKPAAVCMAYPNRFGCADAVAGWESNRPDDKTVGIVAVNPLALGLLTPPGELGWDVAVGEGQSLGLPLNCGGPQLGIFSAREKFMRKMPGRLVGETEDRRGKRCFVLTLQTREQHIRRQRATSNICTNHALMALGAAIALANLGASGLRERAFKNYKNGQLLKDAFAREGFEILGDPVFNEVSIRFETGGEKLTKNLAKSGWMGGYFSDGYYICAATERRSEEEIADFVTAVKRHGG